MFFFSNVLYLGILSADFFMRAVRYFRKRIEHNRNNQITIPASDASDILLRADF